VYREQFVKRDRNVVCLVDLADLAIVPRTVAARFALWRRLHEGGAHSIHFDDLRDRVRFAVTFDESAAGREGAGQQG
jgi:hypothetical protein